MTSTYRVAVTVEVRRRARWLWSGVLLFRTDRIDSAGNSRPVDRGLWRQKGRTRYAFTEAGVRRHLTLDEEAWLR